MTAAAPPLRFLGVVLGGWVCARAAVLAPDWTAEELEPGEPPPPRPAFAFAPSAAAAAVPSAPRKITARAAVLPLGSKVQATAREAETDARPALALDFAGGSLAVLPLAPPVPEFESAPSPAAAEGGPFVPVQPIAAALETGPSRLSVSGWAIVREDGGPQLAAGGALGGSQLGARATYRLGPSLALSGRVSSPLEGDGAEAAVGVEWQPLPQVPIKLLAERRQAIGEDGRSAFALLAHGGVSGVKVAGPVTADAYAQAGVVGARDRDLFADGAVKLNVPVGGGVSVGAGAWGAAQPGVERLDAGPQVTLALPGGAATLKVSAEWRVRVAGDAEPGSGPALTLATDF